MKRDDVAPELHALDEPPGKVVRCRLIPALNPCWRLWMREEGPLELVCLAQVGLELWSVQSDGLSYYFCHNRTVRKVWGDSSAALRRDIHAVRGGFVRELRLNLGEAVSSNAAFQRERPPQPGHESALAASDRLDQATPSAEEGPEANAQATEAARGELPLASAHTTQPAVQVSYRRRRQLAHTLERLPA